MMRLPGFGRVRRSWRRFLWKGRLGRLGAGSDIYPWVVIHGGKNVEIGARVAIAEFVHIWGNGGVSIGDDTIIAAHSVITTATHDITAIDRGKNYRNTGIRKPVRIGRNVWIGSAAIILPGVTIGDNSIIAAGAVVTRDVEPNCLIMGTPGRPVRNLGASNG